MDIPKFKTKKELFAFLIENKQTIMAQKRASIKWADGILYNYNRISDTINKATNESSDILHGELIINTTLLFDSHHDVHLNNIWNRSIKNNPYTILNKQHGQAFEDIISEGEDIKPHVQTLSWKDIGFPQWKGCTEALTYDAIIRKEIHPYMFKKYQTNKVRNHSVEMQYVKYLLAINDPEYKEEFAEWEKWIDKVANIEDAEENGFMFTIYEAKHLGGAAVTKGSNFATPTREIKTDPLESTPNDSLESTPNDSLKGTHKNILLNYLN